jgi:hypothetical protein
MVLGMGGTFYQLASLPNLIRNAGVIRFIKKAMRSTWRADHAATYILLVSKYLHDKTLAINS